MNNVVKLYGFAVETNEDCEQEIFPVKWEDLPYPQIAALGYAPNAKAAKEAAKALVETWQSWDLFVSECTDEYYVAVGDGEGRLDLFEGLHEFGNGNYEKILVVAVDSNSKEILDHCWSKVSVRACDPNWNYERKLVEENYDEELLYKNAVSYLK